MPEPQSCSEADFCSPAPLTGRVFALSNNTHVKHYTKMIYIVLKIKSKPAMSGDMAYITCYPKPAMSDQKNKTIINRDVILDLIHRFINGWMDG